MAADFQQAAAHLAGRQHASIALHMQGARGQACAQVVAHRTLYVQAATGHLLADAIGPAQVALQGQRGDRVVTHRQAEPVANAAEVVAMWHRQGGHLCGVQFGQHPWVQRAQIEAQAGGMTQLQRPMFHGAGSVPAGSSWRR